MHEWSALTLGRLLVFFYLPRLGYKPVIFSFISSYSTAELQWFPWLLALLININTFFRFSIDVLRVRLEPAYV